MLKSGRVWWDPRVRGILALLTGIAFFMIPAFLALFFAAYVLLEGSFLVVESLRTRRTHPAWVSGALHGLVDIAAGVIAVSLPATDPRLLVESQEALFSLRYLIAAWAFISGLLEITSAIRIRRILVSEGLLVLSGILSMSVAILILLFAGAGLAGTAFWVGAFLIASGLALILHAARLRRQKEAVSGASAPRGRSEAPRAPEGAPAE